MTPAREVLRLLRPYQWIKNGFVFVGLVFGHAWGDPQRLSQALWAFAAFCLLASSVYVLNDYRDRERDRAHPAKRRRPLAAGTVSVPAAFAAMGVCLAGGLAIAFTLAGSAPWVYVAYLVLNLAYSHGLKHVVLLDVFSLSAGFMLRILAGTVGIGVPPSDWLLLCGLLLTLFLGFAKRRSELSSAGAGHRRVLEHYSAVLLDQMLTVTATGTIVAYCLYTVSPETIALHGTHHLIYTAPFVLYGLFRYLYRLHMRGGGGDPALDLVRDPHLLAAAAGWIATTAWLLGMPGSL